MKLKKGRILITIIILFILIGLAVGIFIFMKDNKNKEPEIETPNVNDEGEEPPVVKELQILDLESNTRPIAVMINNHSSAQPYQSGLNDAYLVYEIIVEGGITRMLALYQDIEEETKIGPIRSARHYYLDYAMENNALYAHHGWSTYAQYQIPQLGIDNVEVDDWKYGFRDDTLGISYEHTLFTTYGDMMEKAVSTYNYPVTDEVDTLLTYSIDPITNSGDNTITAVDVDIKYSGYQTTGWEYNSETMTYEKYNNGSKVVDYVTKEAVSAKNIITYEVYNYTIAGDTYGRQELSNIGSGEGYYISNGVATLINWTKNSRSGETTFTYKDGSEVVFNDGNTYVQIMPTTGTLTIK